MRTKAICLTLLLTLMALSTFTPRVRAAVNEGDWTATSRAEWWWKYVRPASDVFEVSAVVVVAVRSDQPGYLANRVTFTLTNMSRTNYKGGGAFLMQHGFCDPEPAPWKGPSVWRPSVVARGLLPAVQAGRSIQINAIAYTPGSGKLENFNLLTVGQ
jgi:hypothetical protein